MDATKRSISATLLMEGSVILFFGMTIYGDLMPDDRYRVLWSFFAGAVMAILGAILLKNDKAYDRLNPWLQRVGIWLRVSPVQALLFITGPIFTILTINAAGFSVKMRSPYAAPATWLIGIGLAILGTWNWTEKLPRFSIRTIVWFIAVALLAFPVRGIATDTIPVLLTGDEASVGVNAIYFAKGDWNNLFITGWFSFPTLYSFLQSIGIRVFDDSVEALRIPSALAGALTVGAVYLCGKMMFGHRAGLFASLLLASLHFHIHFSRLGLNNIWDGLWFTLTIAMLWYGWKSHARWAYLLAGLSLGLSQYFYASSKILIIILLVSAVLAFSLRHAQFRYETPNFIAACMVALVVFMPLLWYYFNEPNALLAPFARVSIVKETISSSTSFWKFLFQRIPNSLGVYTHTQLADWYHPGSPILRPIATTFFYLGVIFLLIKDRDSRSIFLIFWLVAFGFVNALSSLTTPAAQRYVASAPACVLIAGYGLDKIAKNLENLWPKVRIVIQVAAYLILVSMVVSDLLFYFVEYTPSTYQDELNSNGMVAYRVGMYLKDQPSNTQVVVYGAPRMGYDSPAILYLAPTIHGMNAPKDGNTFNIDQAEAENILFIFLPEYQDKIGVIEKQYPGGILTAHKAWNEETLFWSYEPAMP